MDKVEEEIITEKPFQFEATIKKENIEDFLKSISIIADEGRINISEDGFKIRMTDPSNICMVTTTLSEKGAFADQNL